LKRANSWRKLDQLWKETKVRELLEEEKTQKVAWAAKKGRGDD
jgi:hypothetical protein